MRKLLTIKHWQLVALVVLPLMFDLDKRPTEIVECFSGLVFLGWIYAIGFYGQEKINSIGLKPMNLMLFQINAVVVIIFSCINYLIHPVQGAAFDIREIVMAIIGLYCGFAVLQLIFFSAKTLAKLECQREVSLDDYLKNILLILAFIFGIWTLQTRINHLFAQEQNSVA